MPLLKGTSRKTISKNIEELHEANEGRAKPRPNKQIVAIALSEARKSGAKIPKKGKKK